MTAASACGEELQSFPSGLAQPSLLWATPFAALLLCIAVLPMVPRASEWWDNNLNKLLVSGTLAALVCAYIGLRGYGFAASAPGTDAILHLLHHSVVKDYLPFVILLFTLYSISGGIRLTGDIPAHPSTNASIMFMGAVLANFVGTTGAAMLLVRPLLQINRERRHVSHTVVFFIFVVCNIGGALLPIGDPPLFLGYLRGVPFFWTLNLFWPWIILVTILIFIYFLLDIWAYKHESPEAIKLDETQWAPLRIRGAHNLLLLFGVILAVALLVPGHALPGTRWIVPPYFLRELALLALAAVSLLTTSKTIHAENHFTFHAIAEVACLFVGLFITMQVPMEILNAAGQSLSINTPAMYFWTSGLLSSFLDNAPTYAVFFELASTSSGHGDALLHGVASSTGTIPVQYLLAISMGSVFMGAVTYVGNGPNFLVKSIAEHRGIKMPGFFKYMAYSTAVLTPVFILISVIFF